MTKGPKKGPNRTTNGLPVLDRLGDGPSGKIAPTAPPAPGSLGHSSRDVPFEVEAGEADQVKGLGFTDVITANTVSARTIATAPDARS